MSWHPIKGASALDSVVWGVELGEPLVKRHQDLIQKADAKIMCSLPSKSVGVQVQVKMSPSGAVSTGSSDGPDHPARLTYARVGPSGVPELQMDLNGQILTVTSRSYDRWDNDKAKVLDLFNIVASALLDEQDIPLIQLELAYKGVFWWDGDWRSGVLSELFNGGNSKLTPDWIFDTNSSWHHDLGEVVDHDGEHIIERLSMQCLEGRVDEQQRRMVVMDTTTRWLGKVVGQPLPVGIHGAFDASGDGLASVFDAERCFDIMHDAAKAMVNAVLTTAMRERWGG